MAEIENEENIKNTIQDTQMLIRNHMQQHKKISKQLHSQIKKDLKTIELFKEKIGKLIVEKEKLEAKQQNKADNKDIMESSPDIEKIRQQIIMEVTEKNEYDEKIKEIQMDFLTIKNEMGGLNATQQLQERYEKHIRILENRLDKDKFSPVTYVWFDFHSECRKMKYENLSKLTNDPKMKPSITEYGYTHIKIDSNKMTTLNDQINVDDNTNDQWKNVVITQVKKQTGVFRTNCIDCLDRTNVVQSVLARLVLHQMLFDLKLSEKPSEDPFEKFKPVFESGFKNIWADHGDYISTAYSGTPALKADFVRTGKRTLMGNLTDGYLSCRRFYINNLRDVITMVSPNVFKSTFKNRFKFFEWIF